MRIVDLLNAGQDILGAVSDAVDSGDYSNLAGDIQDIVFDGTGQSNRNGAGTAYRGAAENGRAQNRNGSAQPQQREDSGRTQNVSAGKAQPKRNYFTGRHPDRRKGALSHMGGLIGGVCFLGATAASLLFFLAAGRAGLRPSPMGVVIFAFFVIMAVACFIVSRKGKKERDLVDRFYIYADIIGTREYFSIEEVASASGQKPEQVRKDMEEFRREGMVPFISMDRNKTTVMLTQHMVNEYEKAEAARLEREEEERQQRLREAERAKAEAEREKEEAEAARKAGKEKKGSRKNRKDAGAEEEMDEEIADLIREGNEAIRTIREINDRIPDDYEMSNKLYRLENIMKRIFERIRKDPARAKDIRKLMNYYLPTTIKLLRAYAELSEQPSGGENVQETRRQIEDAMDTINDAFETLLDDLFQDQAWDIASDINVMKTMMAQDGLVDDRKEKTAAKTTTST